MGSVGFLERGVGCFDDQLPPRGIASRALIARLSSECSNRRIDKAAP
jgi:hypothetical protein